MSIDTLDVASVHNHWLVLLTSSNNSWITSGPRQNSRNVSARVITIEVKCLRCPSDWGLLWHQHGRYVMSMYTHNLPKFYSISSVFYVLLYEVSPYLWTKGLLRVYEPHFIIHVNLYSGVNWCFPPSFNNSSRYQLEWKPLGLRDTYVTLLYVDIRDGRTSGSKMREKEYGLVTLTVILDRNEGLRGRRLVSPKRRGKRFRSLTFSRVGYGLGSGTRSGTSGRTRVGTQERTDTFL